MADVQGLLSKILSAVYGKDVRQSIHDAIKQCYYDGKAGGNDLEARDRAAAAEARISLLAKNPSTNSGSFDKELADIRIAKDGTKYATAGDAVREELHKMHTIEVSDKEPTRYNTQVWINPDETDEIFMPEIKDNEANDFDTWSGKKLSTMLDYIHGECGELTRFYDKLEFVANTVCDNTGSFMPSNYIQTYYFTAESDFYIWNENEIPEGESYLSIALFKNGQQSTDNFVGIYRHTDTQDTLPTAEGKLFVPSGYLVAISSVLGTYSFKNTYLSLGYKPNDYMSLSDNNIKQISEELNIDVLYDKNKNYVTMTSSFDGFDVKKMTNIYQDGFEPNTITDTYYFKALDDFEVYVDKVVVEYLAITICAGTVDDPKFVERYRRYKTEDTLPRADTPLTVKKGAIFCVTVSVNNGFELYTTYKKCGIYLDPRIKIYDRSKLVVDFKIEDNRDVLTIYKLTGSGQYYTGLSMERKPLSAINSNVWRICGVNLYDTNLVKTSHEAIVLGGEWECAIKEAGADDFMGGTLHGDEMMSFAAAHADGKALDLTSDFKIACDKLEFISVSTLNRVDTPSKVVCNHVKKYTITAGEILIDQVFKFLEGMTLEPSYVSMLPINRAYTTRAWRDTQDFIEDISEDGHGQVHTLGNKHKVYMSGSSVTATVDIECESKHTGSLFISDSESPRYNKVYFSFVGYSGGKVVKGDYVNVKTKYTIDVNI